MSRFSRQEYIAFVIENDVVGFVDEPVTLKSGRASHWYVNWRTVTGDAYLTDRLAQYLIDFIQDRGIAFDIIYGVPEGATKLGVIAQLAWAQQQKNYGKGSHALVMGRGAPKEHGVASDRFFLGEPRGRIVVVEDVTTTGGSLLRAIKTLKEAGAEVVAAVGLTNRMERRDEGKSVEEAVREQGVDYYALSDALELLPRACERLNPSGEVRAAVEKEFEAFGIKPLKLT
jgi:orotate phosphoribosyltransferase